MARPTQFQKLSLQLDAENKKLKAKLKNTKKSMGGIGSAAKKMGGAIAAAFAVGAVVNFGKEAMQLAGVAEGVKAAFNKLNSPKLLENLRKATRGTVSDLELMKAAVKAKNFKVPLDKLASFFEFATKRSAQTGESVDFLVKSIVDGIGRKSTLVMDNLGISAAELQGEIQKTGDFGKAAGNIIERELAKAGDVATTSAQKTASWAATMDNLKVIVGTELNKALNLIAPLVEKLMKGLIEGFNWAAQNARVLINEFITLYNESTAFRAVVEGIRFAWKAMFSFATTNIKAVWQILVSTKDIIIAAFTPGKSVKEAIGKGMLAVGELYSNMGKDVATSFNEAVKNTLSKEKLALIPTGEAREKLIADAQALGGEIAKAVKTGGNLDAVKESLMLQEMENKELEDSIDLENELADINEKATQKKISDAKTFGQELKTIQASSIKGFISEGIAAAISKALAFIPPPFNLIAAGTAATAAIGLFNKLVPQSFARGTNYVGSDGLAMVHQGEEIRNRGGVIRDNNGGGRQLVAVVSGSDLKFVLDEYDQRRNNSF